MKLSHQKLKLLYLMKILLEKTDEEHTLTVPEMISELAKLGISAERRSIYDDIEYLKLFGIDICTKKSKTTDYFVASRDFELPELKLLVEMCIRDRFSRDEIAYERLIKILSLYRLTLGQARQEELLEYIFNNCDNPEDMKDLFINLSPYYKTLGGGTNG